MEDKKPVNKKLMVLPLILGISSFCTFALYFYSANHAPYTYTDIILVGPILSFIGVIVSIITRRSRKLSGKTKLKSSLWLRCNLIF